MLEDAHEGARIKQNKGLLFSNPLCDLGRIQTCNLLSRNQVHYSVMLQGQIKDANIKH